MESPEGGSCGAAVESVEHNLCECSAHAAARRLAFGSGPPDLTVLAREPAKVGDFLRRIGRRAASKQTNAAAVIAATVAATGALFSSSTASSSSSTPPTHTPAHVERRSAAGHLKIDLICLNGTTFGSSGSISARTDDAQTGGAEADMGIIEFTTQRF